MSAYWNAPRWDKRAVERLDVLEPRCSVKGCQWVAVKEFSGPFGDRGFCRRHLPRWRVHYEILDRIRSLSDRDIV